ncbi:hypothetical protein [Polaribacter sp. Hel1_85]|uniref:hypothetical protein n=1 Tax=Polaribacter sp. Hel1_85 TaxID=1250005 RepID=UPI00052E2F42|nr:hypothetical protein [Polaribacter sp. Hel1_85]KGL62734.1 hypothetical protein PHEL85_2528 [Polaribacter sp. Hel1_85]
MKKKLYTAILIVVTTLCYSQEKKAGNSIFYADFLIGGSSVSGGSVNAGFSLNYQHNKNLLTFKRSLSKKFEDDGILVFFFLPFTVLDTGVNVAENSFLYGRRHIKNGFSYAFSTGISFIRFNEINNTDQEIISRDNFIGLPLEVSFHWFDTDKEEMKLFGLFPIGKKTGFGMSSGFKLYGTISKKSYIGAGLVLGFGYYKNYN